jgi:hypothetical protein
MTYPFIFENISTMSYVFLHLQYYFMLLDYDSLTYTTRCVCCSFVCVQSVVMMLLVLLACFLLSYYASLSLFAATIDNESIFFVKSGRKTHSFYFGQLLIEFVLFSNFAGSATNSARFQCNIRIPLIYT